MYLIQTDSNDKSTNDVLDWIFFLEKGQKILCRINDTIPINSLTYKLSNNDESIHINNIDFQNEQVQSFWYRRGMFTYPESLPAYNNSLQKKIGSNFYNNFSQEQKHINNSLYLALSKVESLNRFNDNFTNKITNLSCAKKSGLKIPDVLVTNNIDELLNFSSIHEKIITKDIQMNPVKTVHKKYDVFINASVQFLEKKEILEIGEKYKDLKTAKFALYQKYIEKKYELRIFFLKGKFFPMAIFSQANEKTKIDFRNYDTERPNRCIPYQLPPEIEEKITRFMKSIDMNCGSIDMIYTHEGEYIFLEVNPIGQFQWLSKNCNYDIERQIALDLINY